MKVLVVSQYFTPERTVIVEPLAHGLAERGHDVTVLTGYPNYPAGRLYDGYRQRWRGRERHGQVEVLRVPLFIDHSPRAARRTLNYLSFAASAATARRVARDADVVYVYATQMTPAFGPWLSRIVGRGAPYVLHVQDLWPDSIVGSSLVAPGRASTAVVAGLTPWLRSVYRRSAAVIAIAPSMAAMLRDRGVPADRVEVIYNWADHAPPTPAAPARSPGATRASTNVVFAGNVGDMQDVETAVTAAHRAAGSGVRLTIVGDGLALPRVRDRVDELGAENVTFVGRVPPDRMPDIYATADYALVTLKDLPVFHGTIPSKFQAALAQGLPLITSVAGDVRRLVEELEVGFTAGPEDVDSLTGAFRAAAGLPEPARRAMGLRATASYEERFSYEAGMRAVEDVLVAAAADRRRGVHLRVPS